MAVKLLLLAVVAMLTTKTSAQRIWSIAIGHDWGGHEYFDDAGYLSGFGIGLIDLVCTSGNMDCRIVWDNYSNCWQSGEPGQHPSGGKGLMGGWYDACTGWTPTVERIHTFAFTAPYINQRRSYFFVKKGNKDNFDPNDLRGKKIAFLDGWGSNQQCIARQNNTQGHILTKQQIKIYPLPTDAVAGLQSGEVDGVFASEDFWTMDHRDVLDRSDDRVLLCSLSGNGMMSRKDSDFTAHWNAGFKKLTMNNRFKEFCKKTNNEHAHKGVVDCITQYKAQVEFLQIPLYAGGFPY